MVGVRYLRVYDAASEGVYLRFWTPREKGMLSFLGVGCLRISELGLKQGSFGPFLADLRGVWVPSGVLIPLGWNPCSEGVYLRFMAWSV